MKVIAVVFSILCICCPCIAQQRSAAPVVLFENPTLRVLEFQTPDTEALSHPSLFMSLDPTKPAKWHLSWIQPDTIPTTEDVQAAKSGDPQTWKPATLRIELKKRPSPNETPSWPEELDGVRAAPESHKVLFENTYVRVLQVRIAPATKEPFHNHRWPGMFINLDSGGLTGAQRYYNKDRQIKREMSRTENAVKNPPEWKIKWMAPEDLHAIENLETVESSRSLPYRPATIRVEFKAVDSAASVSSK